MVGVSDDAAHLSGLDRALGSAGNDVTTPLGCRGSGLRSLGWAACPPGARLSQDEPLTWGTEGGVDRVIVVDRYEATAMDIGLAERQAALVRANR